MSATAGARYLGGVMILVVGAVHLQQYADFIKDVPTINTLFALNAAGAGVIAVMLAVPRLRLLAAIGGVILCIGSLVAVALSFTSGGIFDYVEPDLRTPIVIAIISEAFALAALATVAARPGNLRAASS